MGLAQPKKMPPSLGGGEVSTTAMKLLKRTEFKKVPQPELIAECVVRVVRNNDSKARSGLRGVINYYTKENRFGSLVQMLRKVMSKEPR
jgi:hypothetical protein